MEHIVQIIEIKQVTHDVRSFRTVKPPGYRFTPGQATDVSVNRPGMDQELRPFTFTSLNDDPYLEFTIKRYSDHHGVTDCLHQLKIGDEIIVRDVWGAIEYKGPGYFLAGGAGITPFVAILRQLFKDKKISGNTLYFSNKTAGDIIYREELTRMLGADAHFILTRSKEAGYVSDHLNKAFIQHHITHFDRPFYICGPDPMIADIRDILTSLGAHAEFLVFEK